MKLQKFFNTEFKDFSNLDNVRSIPSVIDGFKDSQRKAVYGMLNNGQSEIKVAQAAGKFALCLHADTKIKVGNQYISISTLYSLFVGSGGRGFTVETLNEATNQFELDEVIDIIDKGERTDFVEIETEDGNSILVTPEHKILTDNGWKQAQNINEHDFIIAME